MSTLALAVTGSELDKPRAMLAQHIAECAREINSGNFLSILPQGGEMLLRHLFWMVKAAEGTVWILNEEQTHLVPVLNTGPKAALMLASVTQPLTAGCISLSFATGQAFVENRMQEHPKIDRTTDRKLGEITVAMMAAPLRILGQLRGIVSCVILAQQKPERLDASFSEKDLELFTFYVQVFGQLLDCHLVSRTLGL
ncbi:MAG: hypothetical protein ABSH34_05305 [Verrucomicrobiota bacterium]|jgi:hypothetical protein